MKRLLPFSLLGVILLSGCGSDSQYKAAQAENRLMQDRVRDLELNVAKITSQALAAERNLQATREDSAKKDKESREERESLKKRLEETTKTFEEYKSKYRVTFRSRAVGKQFPRLDCGENQVYDNVQILAITPGELRFQHNSGLAKIPLGRLDAGLREQFAYDPKEAAAWLESERKKLEVADNDDGEEIGASPVNAKKKSPARSKQGVKQRYIASLNDLYASARALQADRTCCPVHKKYQLASWSQEAAQLKQRIAAIP